MDFSNVTIGRKNDDEKNNFFIFELYGDKPFNPWWSRYFPTNTQLYPDLNVFFCK